jgi:hypothetical protein
VLLFPAHDGKLYAFAHDPLNGARAGDAEARGWQANLQQELAPRSRPTGPLSFLLPAAGVMLVAAGLGIVFLGGRKAGGKPRRHHP